MIENTLDTFDKEKLDNIIAGQTIKEFMIVRSGKGQSYGEYLGEEDTLAAARTSQKAYKCKSVILQVTCKLVE